MTIAIISDIHANLPALEAVFEVIDQERPDMVFCLGDLVGYAPWPNEVVEMVRARGIATIAGNYDEGVGLDSDDCGCAYKTDDDQVRGQQSIAFTNAWITEGNRKYLRGLPRHIRLELGAHFGGARLLLAHGSPRRINEYLFEERSDQSLLRIMSDAGADVMLFGHTHKPYHKVLAAVGDDEVPVRHAINVGSVGKPKDGDPRACIAFLEIGEGDLRRDRSQLVVRFQRVPYDVERAACAIEASPLPAEFADMLRRAY